MPNVFWNNCAGLIRISSIKELQAITLLLKKQCRKNKSTLNAHIRDRDDAHGPDRNKWIDKQTRRRS